MTAPANTPPDPLRGPTRAHEPSTRRDRATPLSGRIAGFAEVEAEQSGDMLTLRHAVADGVLPTVLLGVSTAAFVLFVVVVLPLLRVTGPAALLWLVIGLGALCLLGLAMQVRTRTTKIQSNAAGITIDQGTPIDREHAAIVWGEVAAIELEPIDPEDGTRGMLLRIAPRAGDPIDTLQDCALGDLTEVRRLLIDRWKAHRMLSTNRGV